MPAQACRGWHSLMFSAIDYQALFLSSASRVSLLVLQISSGRRTPGLSSSPSISPATCLLPAHIPVHQDLLSNPRGIAQLPSKKQRLHTCQDMDQKRSDEVIPLDALTCSTGYPFTPPSAPVPSTMPTNALHCGPLLTETHPISFMQSTAIQTCP